MFVLDDKRKRSIPTFVEQINLGSSASMNEFLLLLLLKRSIISSQNIIQCTHLKACNVPIPDCPMEWRISPLIYSMNICSVYDEQRKKNQTI